MKKVMTKKAAAPTKAQVKSTKVPATYPKAKTMMTGKIKRAQNK
jgi:hypothetical protein